MRTDGPLSLVQKARLSLLPLSILLEKNWLRGGILGSMKIAQTNTDLAKTLFWVQSHGIPQRIEPVPTKNSVLTELVEFRQPSP